MKDLTINTFYLLTLKYIVHWCSSQEEGVKTDWVSPTCILISMSGKKQAVTVVCRITVSFDNSQITDIFGKIYLKCDLCLMFDHTMDPLFIANKTWSSVSNSSLSKTFALCQFRKLKAQKLCFLSPNGILGLKKMSPKIILGQKNFHPEKN